MADGVEREPHDVVRPDRHAARDDDDVGLGDAARAAAPRRPRAGPSAIPSSSGTAPASRTSARIPGPFASGMPGRSEVGRRPRAPRRRSRGRRRSAGGGRAISASPAPAARATTAGVTVTPGRRPRSRPPRRRCRARGRRCPTPTASWTRHAAGSGPAASRPRGPGLPAASSGVVISTGTTASAPAGIGAPVAIRIAVSGRTRASGADPARDSPTTVEPRPAGPRTRRRRRPPGPRSRPSPSCPRAAARPPATSGSARTRPSAASGAMRSTSASGSTPASTRRLGRLDAEELAAHARSSRGRSSRGAAARVRMASASPSRVTSPASRPPSATARPSSPPLVEQLDRVPQGVGPGEHRDLRRRRPSPRPRASRRTAGGPAGPAAAAEHADDHARRRPPASPTTASGPSNRSAKVSIVRLGPDERHVALHRVLDADSRAAAARARAGGRPCWRPRSAASRGRSRSGPR